MGLIYLTKAIKYLTISNMKTVERKVSPERIEAIRGFNRFYTQRIGVLEPYLKSDLSLTEVRVLYELAHRDRPTATAIARDLALDAGYLSRILRRLESRGWLAREPSPVDARQSLLQLTTSGHEGFAPLEQRSREQAAALLGKLSETEQQQLLSATQTMQQLLGADMAATPLARKVELRELKPGDMGWVVEMHGAIYAAEFGWNHEFEALVASIASKMLNKHQPAWERGWIAELDGRRVGSVFVVRRSATIAQLRLLILAQEARGLGLGTRLTDECLAFARSKGYRKIMLWTNSNLLAARHIYAQRGFRLTHSEPYRGFGTDLTGETWELRL